MKPILALALFLVLPLAAAEFRSDWQGTRPWVGPEYWAGPLYDWKTVDGAVVAVAAKDRLLHLLSHRPLEPQKGFQMRVSVELLASDKVSNPAAVWAGMAVGVKGMMEDPRHVAVWPKQRIAAVVRSRWPARARPECGVRRGSNRRRACRTRTDSARRRAAPHRDPQR